MSDIQLHAAGKKFGGAKVLVDLDLVVTDGSITAILGQSGSGKTTLLRLVAGFEHLDEGTLTIGGRVVDDSRRAIHAQHRRVGYVPQEGALFPHLTVAGNIGFGLPRSERGATAGLIEMVGLDGLGRRYPHQLSGGQQQRVALARALATRPDVVLLDEPFSSLDASLRASIRGDVVHILNDSKTTTVIVTHDQDEALAIADQVAVLRQGRIVACGSPRDLYRDPPSPEAAAHVGETNFLPGQATGAFVRCALGSIPLLDDRALPESGPVEVLIRPEQLTIGTAWVPSATPAVIAEIQYHGHDTLATAILDESGGEHVVARVPGGQDFLIGAQVWVAVTGPVRAWAMS